MTARYQIPGAMPPPCRLCGAPLHHTVVDLSMSPLCQRHVRPHELRQMEPFYPLYMRVCDRCFLVQFFRELGTAVLSIEPAANVARAAIAKGIPTVNESFGTALARCLALDGKADLIVANTCWRMCWTSTTSSAGSEPCSSLMASPRRSSRT